MHRFFLVDQVDATVASELQDDSIELVTRKLYGQMVYGVVVAGTVQFWTRAALQVDP